MNTYIIKESQLWGNYYLTNPKTIETYLRCQEKLKIISHYPFIDHHKKYICKPSNQRISNKQSQTFLVSFTYNYDSFIGDKEIDFINHLETINLRFYKEPCIFRNKSAYKIFIMDTDVDLEVIRNLVKIPE
jgi:hypothetical protein